MFDQSLQPPQSLTVQLAQARHMDDVLDAVRLHLPRKWSPVENGVAPSQRRVAQLATLFFDLRPALFLLERNAGIPFDTFCQTVDVSFRKASRGESHQLQVLNTLHAGGVEARKRIGVVAYVGEYLGHLRGLQKLPDRPSISPRSGEGVFTESCDVGQVK